MKYVIAAAVIGISGIAQAHIQLLDPPPRTSMLKNRQCGDPAAPRSATPTMLQPGATITVKWLETIEHPGHYRISFDNDGTDFFIPPNATATTVGMDPTVMIDLIADVQGNFPPAGRMYTKTITLPNIECTNCTLQLIQLMTDKPPYSTGTTSDDIYFQCADLVLSNSAPPPMPDAGAGMMGGDASTMDPGGSSSGGCSTGSGAGPAVALALLALRRRRR